MKVFWVLIIETFSAFLSLEGCNNPELTLYSANRVKSVLRYSLGTRAKFWVTKKENDKPRESDISPIRPDALNGSIVSNFGVRSNIVTHIKFYVNLFRGFGAVTPQNLCISKWLVALTTV